MDRRRFLRLLGLAALALQGRAADGPAMNKQSVRLFLCGDVMTGRGVDQILPHPSNPRLYESSINDARDYVELAERQNGPIAKPVGFSYIWGDALAELKQQAPDALIINLETSITRSNAYLPKGINYRMSPENIPCLTAAAIDCCVLANNHVLDWGEAGLEETLTTLARNGIKSAGAGRTLDAARSPAIIDLSNNSRVVLFSFGMESSGIPWDWGITAHHSGVNLIHDHSMATVRTIAQQVSAIKQPGDIVIASIHWGSNWGYHISDDQRRFAHALVDEGGVNVIHGHSSHHVKGIEVYKGHPILYGCGDFLNDYEGIGGYEEYRDDLGLMYFPSLDTATGQLLRLEMTPTRIKNLRVNRASSKEAQWLAEVLNREGKALGTRAALDERSRLVLEWK